MRCALPKRFQKREAAKLCGGFSKKLPAAPKLPATRRRWRTSVSWRNSPKPRNKTHKHGPASGAVRGDGYLVEISVSTRRHLHTRCTCVGWERRLETQDAEPYRILQKRGPSQTRGMAVYSKRLQLVQWSRNRIYCTCQCAAS